MRHSKLVGAVSNCADAVRLETAPTGERKCLFIFRIHHNSIGVALLTVKGSSGPGCVGPIGELIGYVVIRHDMA